MMVNDTKAERLLESNQAPLIQLVALNRVDFDDLVEMTWDLIKWTPNQFEFALNFTYPLNVS